MQYYTQIRGHKEGPFSLEELANRSTRGKFSLLYQVSENGVDWRLAKDVREIVVSLSKAGTPQSHSSDADSQATNRSSVDDDPGTSIADADSGNADMRIWHYTCQNRELGPDTVETLLQLIRSGQVGGEDFVWCDGMESWLRVTDVPALAPSVVIPRAGGHVTASGGQAVPPVIPLAPMAVSAFVAGLLGVSLLFCLASIPAVVFGHIALTQIRESQGNLSGRGLALTGMILGYVVIVPTIIVAMVYVAILVLGPSHGATVAPIGAGGS